LSPSPICRTPPRRLRRISSVIRAPITELASPIAVSMRSTRAEETCVMSVAIGPVVCVVMARVSFPGVRHRSGGHLVPTRHGAAKLMRSQRNGGIIPGEPLARGDLSAPRGSGEEFLDDVSVDVGKAKVATSVTIRQFLVVEAEQVQDRRVQVVDVDLVAHGGEAKLIGSTVDVSTTHPAASQPHPESVMVVIAPTQF